jgi:enediyne polyketide synthase
MHEALYHGRLLRPLEVGQGFRFLASPCEQAPTVATAGGNGRSDVAPRARQADQAGQNLDVGLYGPSSSSRLDGQHLDNGQRRPPSRLVSVPTGSAAALAGTAAPGAPTAAGTAAATGPSGTADGVACFVPGPAGNPDAATGGEPAESVLDLLRRLVAERAELPVDMVRPDSRLLDNLHLSSITVGQVMNQAAQQLGIPVASAPTNFATATLQELAQALEELTDTAAAGGTETAPVVAGAAAWARPFVLDLDEVPLPARGAPETAGRWEVHSTGDHPLAEPLRRALEAENVGVGVLVCLPPDCDEEHLELALRGAQEAAAAAARTRFVLVQHGRGAAGLAKTLSLEAPHLRTTIVHMPPPPSVSAAEAVGWVVAEVAATARYAEAYYDDAGVRRVPTLRAMPVRASRTHQPLDSGDVLLVTGGGKGITSECALAVAADSGAKLAVLGRSDPAQDGELAANLRRMAERGVAVHYARADVTDAGQVRAAVAELVAALGPVTGVLHGAGRNEPGALTGLDIAAFRRTFAPKIGGLRAVLEAVEPERLKLLVTFGSIIGRAGLRGEAHYATANEWLAELTAEVAAANPGCRGLCMEWSVWSGVGMGERLSVVESLARDGVTPITPDQGVAIMRRLVADPDAPSVVVVSGRTEGIDTVRYDRPALPLLRFVERPLVRYHGVELVTEVELSAGSDRYLADHLLDGNLLFPAVFGMEAMAQVATAATGRTDTPVIEDAEFLRPIVVPPDGSTTIRVAATVTGDDTVEVAIRSAETGFAAEHFRARLRFTADAPADGPPQQAGDGLPAVPLDPDADLYGDTLFQGRRFQRLRRYHRAAARHVDADVAVVDATDWFASFLPGGLLLGDPGMRDALMHGNQVCVPDGTLLPAGIERVHPGGARLAGAGQVRYCATERSRDGDTYIYDIAVRTAEGEVVERWDGLRLQAVRKKDGRGPWVAPLLGSYLERTLGDLVGAQVAVAVEPHGPDEPRRQDGQGGQDGRDGQDGQERRAVTAVAAGRVFGHPVEVRYRPDGRPEADGGRAVSASHGAGVTLCVAAPGNLGCDVEAVAARSEQDWHVLLGAHAPLAALVAAELGEDADTASTRVWAAAECLAKSGLVPGAPLTVEPARRDAWAVFASGTLRIVTLATTLRGVEDPVVFAVLTDGRLGDGRPADGRS